MAAAAQTKETSDANPAIRIDIPHALPPPARTEVTGLHQSANLALTAPERSTVDPLQRRTDANVVWSAPTPVQGTAYSAASGREEGVGAKGVLLHVTEESAQCEFLQGPSSTKVWLPRSLFPAGVSAGFTFFLSVDTEDGFRAPRITPRKPDLSPDVEQRLARVLEQLDK